MILSPPSVEGKNGAARLDELRTQAIGRWPDIFQTVLGWSNRDCQLLRGGKPIECPSCGQKLKPASTFTAYGTLKCNGCFASGLQGLEVLREFSSFSKADVQKRVSDYLKNSPHKEPSTVENVLNVNGRHLLTITPLSQYKTQSVNWLWESRFPLGSLSLLVGRPGCGKSSLTADMAARISVGAAWPDGAANEAGNVLLLSAEDCPARVIRPRIEANGGNIERVQIINNLASLTDVDELNKKLASIKQAKLLVVDPIGSYLGRGCDAHRDSDVRAVLSPLAELAKEHQIAVLVVAHHNKGKANVADDATMGSIGFVGLARAVWHLVSDPSKNGRKLLLSGKNNYAAAQSGLAFCIEGTGPLARLEWEPHPVNMSADDFFARRDGMRERSAKAAEAVDWLRENLASGPRSAEEIAKAAQQEGISTYALRTASETLKVRKSKGGFQGAWQWSLPPSGPD